MLEQRQLFFFLKKEKLLNMAQIHFSQFIQVGNIRSVIYLTYQSLISFISCTDIRLICQCHRLLWVLLLHAAFQLDLRLI